MKKLRKLSVILSVVLSLLVLLSLSSCESLDGFLSSLSSVLDEMESGAQSSEESSSGESSVESNEPSSESSDEADSESSDESSSESNTDLPSTSPAFFEAKVNTSTLIDVSFYTDGNEVDESLSGIYYSSSTPGGAPKGDGTGSIWLVLKPTKKYGINKIDITGEYERIESLGSDIYRIHGVKSDLTVNLTVKTLPDLTDKLFEGYGYGITDDGKMCVSWVQNEENPLRYVEITYPNGNLLVTDYIDASCGSAELFTMIEDKDQTVTMRAVSEDGVGKRVTLTGCFMSAPREVSFPRVEITTENFVLPTFETVNSPEGCWGSGITNATYEQCIVTLYNENDEVVYTSTTDKSEAEKFLGAKMKVRGNTSASHASDGRYPYKIKLDKKFDLLEPLIGRADDGKAYADKDWLLLNYGDDSFRMIGDAVADAVGTEWSPEYCYVTLYLNGEYRGLYVLSEAVERGNGTGETKWRVGAEADGFVFECDAYWWNEDLYFSTPMTENTPMYFTFKYPDSDDMTEQNPEYLYIKNYMIEFEEALQKNDDSYLEYIDLDSFVKWLLVSDYLCISDGGGCNLYLYKEDGSDETKVKMGPNWDFDSYMGSYNALATIRIYWREAPFYYHQLIKKESFMNRYRELYNETRNTLTTVIDDAFSKIDTEAHASLLQYDNARFGTSTTTLEEEKAKFYTWLDLHLEYMDSMFAN